MKTAKILSAVALPLMLAACNQDAELESLAVQGGDYSNIPTVDVTFTANKGADTRMATQFGWELKDMIGMAWLGDGTTVNSGYSDGKAYQNTPFYCSDVEKASFKSENLMYVGKYFAYMPFNEDVVSIENIPFTVEGQKLSADRNDYAKHSIYITPALINLEDPATAEAGDNKAGLGQNLPLNMRMLSNAVKLNLTFDNAAGINDLKVTGIKIDVKATTASKLVKTFNYNGAQTVSADASNWTEVEPVAFFGASGAVPSQITAGEAISLTNAEGLAVTDNKLTTYAIILPAYEALSGSTLELTVSTNYGDVIVSNDADEYDADAEDTKANGGYKIYNGESTTAVDVDDAVIFTKFGQSGTIDVTVNAKEIAVPATNEVANQAELEAMLNAMAATGQSTTTGVTFTIKKAKTTDTKVTLTDFTMPEGLKTPITLEAEAGASDGIVFAGNTVVNKTLSLGSKATVTGNMTVKAIYNTATPAQIQSTLTLAASTGLTIDFGAVLTNEGKIDAGSNTITINGSDDDEVDGKYVNAAKDAVVSNAGTFTNKGEVEWITGANLPTITTQNEGIVYAEVDNLVEANAAAKAGVTTARFVNNTSFTNLAQLTIDIDKIETIEVYAPVSINLQQNGLDGQASTLNFSALTNLKIMEGGSLTITSDNEGNIFKTSASGVPSTTPAITVSKNAALDLSDLTLDGFIKLNNSGTTTFTNVEREDLSTVTNTDGGVFTEK